MHTIRSRALIGGPASIARRATRLRRVLRAEGAEKRLRYMREYIPENIVLYVEKKVHLNASRTSKRRASGCLEMSWRRNEMFKFYLY